MSKILPLRNIREQITENACILCGAVIPPCQGYAVIAERNRVEGYVCQGCFEEPEPDDLSESESTPVPFFSLVTNDLTLIN